MRLSRSARIVLATVLVLIGAGGGVTLWRVTGPAPIRVVAHFENSNGIFVGDDVMVLGVPVGRIEKIEPQPDNARITFTVDGGVDIPADASAVIISPTIVSARALALTPAYTGGPRMGDGAVIPRERTAVPVEYDDLRNQLEKLTEALQPTEPGGLSTLGRFVDTAADNLRGQGAEIRQALIQVSQAFSILGDHSGDVFGSVKNLNTLVGALQGSTDLMRQLNNSLAAVTGLLADDPAAIAAALTDLNDVLTDAQEFVAQNVEAIGTTTDKAASVAQALGESLDDLKQSLHIAPTAFSNFVNIYEPANASLTGALAAGNFANPIQFICAAVQATSRLNSEQAAKLCVQYLAPIVKNRQYNFPPIGMSPFVGAMARPNEVTFSEDWLRDQTEAGRVRNFFEGPLPAAPPPPTDQPPAALPAEAPVAPGPGSATPTDPADGLHGLMVPPGGGA
jgi:phospholipid/cholesterol/gamma-HCH transport system substrate-binding protein